MRDRDVDIVQSADQGFSRRRFIKRALATGATASASGYLIGRSDAGAQTAAGIRSFDHAALPMQNTEAMVSFYRALGCQVREGTSVCSVHFGDQKINFHRPEMWQRETFTLRAPAARPPCGDLCFVWGGTPDALQTALDKARANIIEGPVKRDGGRNGGNDVGVSVYVRDPDGNLLEFMIY